MPHSRRATVLIALIGSLALLAATCSSTPADTETTSEAASEAASSSTEAPVDDDTDTTDDSDHDDTDHDDTDHDDAEHEDTDHAANDTAIDLFVEGALASDPTTDECTLTDGSTTECYTITVVGLPANHDVGPFCPTSITDTDAAGGLWLDGEDSYVIDGPFFTELADIYGDELWNNIYNDDGSVNVIDNAEDFQVAARPDITEEFYYHCVDGDIAWVEGGQPTTTIQVPVSPVLSNVATVQFATGAHSTLGVTLNGATLSGSADMTAILASYTIAAFDDCGGHINPALGYHVHGSAECVEAGDAPEGETAPFAIAIDGHTVHAPYDEDSSAALDACNGHTSDEYGYHYHAGDLEANATLTCLMGLTAEDQNAGGRPGGGGDGRGGERPERPEGG